MLKKFTTSVVLHERTEIGRDELDYPVYKETEIKVNGVLIGEPTSDDIAVAEQIYGKRAAYTLAIPKGDNHTWTDSVVEFYGQKWRVFTLPTEGIENALPLYWNKKVMVERYE